MSASLANDRGTEGMDDAQVMVLRRRHAELEQHIANELARPLPDAGVLMLLKREKLRVKDQLARA